MNSAQQAYRSATVEGVTQLRAQILVLDQICAHLNHAATAATRHDIAGRCQASNEALLLLGHLESWATLFEDPALVSSLQNLYIHSRVQILSAQRNPLPQPFLELATLLAGASQAWRTKESNVYADTDLVSPVLPSPVDNSFPSEASERRWQC